MTRNLSTKKPDIKILVVTHKPSAVIENELIKPIQVGVALSGKKLDGMAYYDNEGINISDKNRSYCELTAVYWAWKNLEADYYGLFHYRRYFSFSPKQDEDPVPGRTYADVEAALNEAGFDTKVMRETIEEYDLIIPRKEDMKKIMGSKSIYAQYKEEHYIEDLEYCLAYVKKNYPQIAPFTEALHVSDGYFCNMFIMKKPLFNKYCAFIFDVLANFEGDNDISEYDVKQYRVTGFLAERLTNIYIQYLQSLNKYKIKELQIAFFKNTDPKLTLTPISKEKNVGVVLAANNFYVPYISTLIHSIADHSSRQFTYDINIFHHDITAENMDLLRSEFRMNTNFYLRFYDISPRYEEYKKLFTRGHFAIETYFRLFIQDIMVEYPKVLYLDGDMIVNDDIAKLYQTDVRGYLMAACLDPDTAGLYNGFEPQKKNYMDNILKIKNPYEYFQAGVILFNLDEMRKTLEVSSLVKFAASYKWELLDQDVLNYIAQGRVKYVDMAWNVMYDWRRIRLNKIVVLAPVKLYLAYIEARKNPKIIHYAGPEKPWHEPDGDFAGYFWQVARRSIFYEQILARMSDWRTQNIFGIAIKGHRRAKWLRKAAPSLRRTADIVAPAGTMRRKPITLASKAARKIIR